MHFDLHKGGSSHNERSKGDFEVYALGVESNFLDLGFSYVTGKRFIYVGKAMGDVIKAALGEHLNRAVWQVADKAGQPMTIRNVGRGEAKANALNPPHEDYMFGNPVHCQLTVLC